MPARIFRRIPMQFRVLLETIDGLLAQKDDVRLKNLLTSRPAQEIARVINRLSHGKRKTFAIIPPELQADVALRLSDESRTYVLPRLSDQVIARFIHFNEEDDAADILQVLPDERRPGILALLKGDKRAKIETLLRFHPESAGGLMDLNYIVVPMAASIRDVAETVRHHLESQKKTPMVIVEDDNHKTRGFLPHKNLFLASQSATAGALMHRLPTMHHSTDQETILPIATRERGEVFGVVDENEQLLGVIHLRDLLRIAQLEATEDVYKFAGVSPEEEILGSPWVAVRMRYKWLMINLVTAFLASSVVSLFSDTIGKYAMLAAFMPIVAGMGGNAGTQALAVTVRGLAVRDLSAQQRGRLLGKEVLTGLTNGCINGALVGGIVFLLLRRADVALILWASMIINYLVAGVFGAVIPLTLRALRIDPAVASSVFVTAATDFFGFLTFLGLATIFLP